MTQTATSEVLLPAQDEQDFFHPEPARPGLRPGPGFARPMILTSMRWFSVARLAHSLVEAGS